MKAGILGLMLVVVSAVVLGQDEPKKERKDLPDGPAKELFIKVCEKCHGSENVVRSRNTRDKWESIVEDMASRGAEGTDEEFERILDYLVANFGKK